MRVRPVACHCARHMNCRAPTALAGPPPARLASMLPSTAQAPTSTAPLPIQSVAHAVEWWTGGGLERMGSEHGLDCMLEVVACRALDAQSLARSSCTKEGAAAFANSEKAMWPVAEVSCSRVLACGEGSFAKTKVESQGSRLRLAACALAQGTRTARAS